MRKGPVDGPATAPASPGITLDFQSAKDPALAARGYLTMGDWHSTRPAEGGDAESTRFDGLKYECGLHLDSGSSDFQI